MGKSLHSAESKIFKSHLRLLREKAGMTQRDLAKAVGWNHSLIAKIELGDRRLDVIEFYWLILALGADPAKEAELLMKSFENSKDR
ncbi:MAG: helix-turn-helix transcriptional regulator [Verrucomicrobiota bacterium]